MSTELQKARYSGLTDEGPIGVTTLIRILTDTTSNILEHVRITGDIVGTGRQKEMSKGYADNDKIVNVMPNNVADQLQLLVERVRTIEELVISHNTLLQN